MTRAETAVEATKIGGYRVVRRLATGGTSDVLLARAEGPHGFERTVVLKLLLSQFRSEDEFARMFAREAAAYARLSHPSIVRLFDFFALPVPPPGPGVPPNGEGQLVMVLEHVDGPPLSRLRSMLKTVGREIDDRVAIFIATRVFSALAAAHAAVDERGALSPVIHRDVNPSNVLVPWDGHVKLGDFGVAKVTGSTHQSAAAGMIKGTYGYMAPEQVTGDPVTPRADVYACAIILWELLTRRRAFQRGALPEIEALRAMAEPRLPSIDSLRSDLDRSIRDALKRALEPRADRRTITAEEMVGVLSAAVPLEAGRERLVTMMDLVRNDARAAAAGNALNPQMNDLANAVEQTIGRSAPPKRDVAPPRPPSVPRQAAVRPGPSGLPTSTLKGGLGGPATLAAEAPTAVAPPLPHSAQSLRRPSAAQRLALSVPPELKKMEGSLQPGSTVAIFDSVASREPPMPPPPATPRGLGDLPPEITPPPGGGQPVGDAATVALAPPLQAASNKTSKMHALKSTVAMEARPPHPTGESDPPLPMLFSPVPPPFPAQGDRPVYPVTTVQMPPPALPVLAAPAAPFPPPPQAAESWPGDSVQHTPSGNIYSGPGAASEPKKSSSAGIIAASLLLLVAGLVGGTIVVMRHRKAPPPVVAIAPPPTTPPTTPPPPAPPPDPTPTPTPTPTPAPSPDPTPTAPPTPTPAAVAEGMGVLKTAGATPGHRIFVDNASVGQTPASVTVKCGTHTVKLGSAGKPQSLDIPCGGELVVGDK